jgi:hypothetical protein
MVEGCLKGVIKFGGKRFIGLVKSIAELRCDREGRGDGEGEGYHLSKAGTFAPKKGFGFLVGARKGGI